MEVSAMLHESFERRPSSEAARFEPAYPDEPTPDAFKSPLEALFAWNAKLWVTAAAINGEYMDFLKRRVKSDLAFGQQLTGCKSAADFCRMGAAFWTNAADDYRAEFSQLAEQWNTIATEGATALATCTSGTAAPGE